MPGAAGATGATGARPQGPAGADGTSPAHLERAGREQLRLRRREGQLRERCELRLQRRAGRTGRTRGAGPAGRDRAAGCCGERRFRGQRLHGPAERHGRNRPDGRRRRGSDQLHLPHGDARFRVPEPAAVLSERQHGLQPRHGRSLDHLCGRVRRRRQRHRERLRDQHADKRHELRRSRQRGQRSARHRWVRERSRSDRLRARQASSISTASSPTAAKLRTSTPGRRPSER